MSDILNVTGSNYTSEPASNHYGGPAAATGALRRKYNFGDMVSELALAQDPFFRFLSKVSKFLYLFINSEAVLIPIPGTPGILSDGSPARDCTSTT